MKKNSGFIGKEQLPDLSSGNGVHSVYDCYVSRLTSKWPRTKGFQSISPNVANHYEGETKDYVIYVNGYSSGDLIYYTYDSTGGTVNSTDFSTDFSGSVVVGVGGSAVLSPQLARDADSEASDTFKIQIRDGSVSGTVLGESGTITIPNPSYTLTPSTSTPNEGTTVTMTLAGTNTYTGTHYYSLEGTAATASDISSDLTGSFSFDGSSGTFTIDIRDDFTTEGSETLTVKARVNSTTGPVVGVSTITIQDSSVQTIATITPSATSVNEGSSVTFTVNTTNMTSGTLSYQVGLGTQTEADDFSSTYGTVSIASSTGSFSITPKSDSITDSGTETFTVKIINLPDGDGSTLTTSTAITINDTSTGDAESTVPIYERTYIGIVNYIQDDSNTNSQRRSSYMVTNNEFVDVTTYRDKPYTEASGTSVPFVGTDYIYFRGYSGPGHRFKISDLSHQQWTSGSNSADTENLAGLTTSTLVGSNWSGSLVYTSNADVENLNNSFPFTDSTVVNHLSGLTTSASGYTHGVVGLGTAIYAAKGLDSSSQGIRASRMFRSTDNGVNFRETAQLDYRFGGYLGSYPDYDGGKLLWWFNNEMRSSTDGETWSTAVSETGSPKVGSPSYRGNAFPCYNKHTQKFYLSSNSVYQGNGATSVGISTNGYNWDSSGTPQYNGTQLRLFNVVVMPNGDMVGMAHSVSTSRFVEFYRFPRNGTSITWNTDNLVNRVAISSVGNFYQRQYVTGVFGPHGAVNGP